MNKEKATAYLKKKGKETSKDNVEKVMQEGKIYGDPIVETTL